MNWVSSITQRAHQSNMSVRDFLLNWISTWASGAEEDVNNEEADFRHYLKAVTELEQYEAGRDAGRRLRVPARPDIAPAVAPPAAPPPAERGPPATRLLGLIQQKRLEVVDPQPLRSKIVRTGTCTSTGGLKVIQKVNVGQKVKKSTKKPKKKSVIAQRRKDYNKLKKELLARIRKEKSESYKTENSKIKAMPSKERAAARKALKQQLQARFERVKKQFPGSSKLKRKDLDRLISLAKTIKW